VFILNDFKPRNLQVHILGTLRQTLSKGLVSSTGARLKAAAPNAGPPRVFRVSAHSAALAVTAAKEAILSPQRQAPGEILRSRCRSGWHPGDHRL